MEREKNKRDIIVIGASAGGFDAIKTLVYNLPANLDISVFIVWHMAPHVKGVLPQLLNKQSNYLAEHAVDMEHIRPGRIYVAPPDHHLVISDNLIRTTYGPKENRFRPAIDPLFRSAAYNYGQRVIGIILSGALDDGSAGLLTVKKFGGIAIVQDPSDAQVSSMPESAIRTANVDYVVPLSDMPTLIERILNEPFIEKKEPSMKDDGQIRIEVQFALNNDNYKEELFKFGDLTRYTCPDCHGVLTSFREGGIIRFRCHTGHSFSADSLLTALSDSIEDNLWTTVRSMHESAFLLNHLGDHFAEYNDPLLAAKFFKEAAEADRRSKILCDLILKNEGLSIEKIEDDSTKTVDASPTRNS